MDFRTKREFHIILGVEELRLVQRGLRCLLTDEEKPAALELQERILGLRHKVLEQEFHESIKLMANIEAAHRAAAAAGEVEPKPEEADEAAAQRDDAARRAAAVTTIMRKRGPR